jgi:glyoxylase-like metal-dependent hydrolase (beta-lactamase superfamily II)
MHRRIFLRNTAILSTASLLFQQQALAQIFGIKQSNIKMLRRNVGIFTERGGTIGFLLSNEGIVVVDSQFPESAAHFIEQVKTLGPRPFKYLLNTHHHGDHTAGNIAFKGLVEQVIAHENAVINQKTTAEKNNTTDKQLYAATTFREDWKQKLGDEKVKADYFGAAHTNGDAIFHFDEANITHLGDLMFNKRHPFVDRSAGANMANWIKVLDKVVDKSHGDTILIFGHSLHQGQETGTIEDIKKFQDYLAKVLRFAEAEIKRGVSKEEFIKHTAIPGVTEWQGDGIQRPLTAAYEEVSAK